MIKRHFCYKVLAGNWREEEYIDKEREKCYLEKEREGKLITQRLKHVVDTFYNKTTLSECSDGFLHLGNTVKICHNGLGLQFSACLSVNIHQMDLIEKDNSSRYVICAMKNRCPIVRNTFVILGADGRKTDSIKPVCYGEQFALRSMISNKETMVLYSDMASLGNTSTVSGHQEVTLTSSSSRYTIWKVLPTNLEYSLELEGTPVPVNVPVMLNHVFTNRNLCLEDEHQIRTLFGDENEVTTQTYLGGGRSVVDRRNVWSFVSEEPQR